MTGEAAAGRLALVSISGPERVSLDLTGDEPLTLGRRAGHSLELTGDDRVSRDHARFEPDPAARAAGRWLLTDTGSKHGTWLNGLQIARDRPTPVSVGDIVVISPWTFRIVDRDQSDDV
ncbi:MAG: FHA domain-containing protein, partial [Planctomycetota bacterium]|nr:FHA domain-containing protein [Planctomycetota bacterium]